MRKLFVFVFVAALLMSLGLPVFSQGLQNVELHGYMQNRFYSNPDYSARFVTERVSLSAVGNFGDATAYIETYIHPWLTDKVVPSPIAGPPNPVNPTGTAATADQFRVYLESAYVDLPFAKGRLRLGKGRQLNFGMTPSYPNRKTTQYGILAETFTQDRITGAQFDYKCAAFDFGASLFSDLQVETRSIGDFSGAINSSDPSVFTSTVKHFTDKDDPANPSGALAASMRLGLTKPNYQIHISGMTGGLSQADADFIASQYSIGTGLNDDRSHNKYGVDGSISTGPYILQAEAYQGDFSFVKVSGYSVLVGYQPKDKQRFYARWAALNNNRAPNGNFQATWDTQQLTFGFVQPIRKGVWVEVNFEDNLESPPAGIGSKRNNLLFAEFFTGF